MHIFDLLRKPFVATQRGVSVVILAAFLIGVVIFTYIPYGLTIQDAAQAGISAVCSWAFVLVVSTIVPLSIIAYIIRYSLNNSVGEHFLNRITLWRFFSMSLEEMYPRATLLGGHTAIRSPLNDSWYASAAVPCAVTILSIYLGNVNPALFIFTFPFWNLVLVLLNLVAIANEVIKEADPETDLAILSQRSDAYTQIYANPNIDHRNVTLRVQPLAEELAKPNFIRAPRYAHHTIEYEPTTLNASSVGYVQRRTLPYCVEMLQHVLSYINSVVIIGDPCIKNIERLQKRSQSATNYNVGDCIIAGKPMTYYELVTSTNHVALDIYTKNLNIGQAIFSPDETIIKDILVKYSRVNRHVRTLFRRKKVATSLFYFMIFASNQHVVSVAESWTSYMYNEVSPVFRNKAFPLQDLGKIKINVENFYREAKTGILALVKGAFTEPIPNISEVDNFKAGFEYRVNTKLPDPDPTLLAEFNEFTTNLINREFQPIGHVLPTDEWLEATSYPQNIKQNLDTSFLNPDEFKKNSAFIKTETYPSIKPPRLIMNVAPAYKVVEGPIIKQIEQSLHNKDWCLKGKPTSDWAGIIEKLHVKYNGKSYVTDFTSFESSFTAELKDSMENKVIERMFGSTHPEMVNYLRTVQNGVRKYTFRRFLGTAAYKAKRASGDQRTSCMNTISNYLITSFVLHKNGIEAGFVCEGDDGLILTQTDKIIDTSYYLRLGFKIKLDSCDYKTSGFCGFRFAEGKSGLNTMATYPKHISRLLVTKEPNTSVKRQLMLRSAAALSYSMAYPNDPLVGPLSRHFLKRHANYNSLRLDYKWRLDGVKDVSELHEIRNRVLASTPDTEDLLYDCAVLNGMTLTGLKDAVDCLPMCFANDDFTRLREIMEKDAPAMMQYCSQNDELFG